MVSQTASEMGSIPVTEETRQALVILERIRKQIDNGTISKSNIKDDVDLILGVLENPVFNSILSIQESLSELKKQIAKHPSILADDFDITAATGELILNVPNVPIQNQNSASYEPSSDNEPPNYDYDRVRDKHQAKDNNSTSSEVLSPADIPPDYALATVSTDAYAEEFRRTISRGARGRDVFTIQLFKPEGCSLGFSVVGLRNEGRGELGIFIQEVQLNGIAGRDGRLHEGDQILAIDGQPLDTNISHQQAIGILQQARGLVELIVARGGCLPTDEDSQQSVYERQLPETNNASASSQQPPAKLEDIHLQLTQATATTSGTGGLERTPSTLSDNTSNQTATDMVLTTEWAQVESVELVNDGSGLGFGIIGGRSTGVVVKTIVPGGVADRDGRLQSGDHILQIGDVNLRGMGSEQVAAVLRHAGEDVRLIVARPVEPTSPDYNSLQSGAPIVPTRILADPEEVEKYLSVFSQSQNGYPDAAMIPYGDPAIVDPSLVIGVNGVNSEMVPGTDYLPSFVYQATVETQMAPDLAVPYQSPYQSELGGVSPAGPEDSVLRRGSKTLSSGATGVIGPFPVAPEESEEDRRLRESIKEGAEELPEMETFEVELVKDQQGLGITIAGYVCEKEEISGIFVKSIAKGSAAHLCGRIRINDQIIEVDGRPLHGYTNHQAVEVLRNTGKMVKLRLARYLRGAKYEQLQQAIATGELPTPPSSITQAQVHEPIVEATNAAVLLDDFSAYINEDYSGPLDPKTEVAVKAKWSKIMGPDYEIVVAQISKFRETGGLGISLEGTVDVEDGKEVRPHHYIRSVLKDGPVGMNERLRSGDELLEVNGKRLFGLNHVEVVQTLKDLPRHVRLVCARCLKPFIDDPTLPGGTFTKYSQFGGSLDFDSLEPSYSGSVDSNRQNVEPFGGSLTSLLPSSDRLVKAKSDGSLAIGTSSSPPESSLSKLKSRSLEPLTGLAMWSSEPQIIDLVKGERGLGFSILDYQDPMNPNETIIVIRSLVPGGVAQQDGRLIPGDRLLSVNDIHLENATLDAAVQALKGAARGVVRIGVAKPLPLPESQTPLEESSSTQFIPRKLSDSSSALSTVEQAEGSLGSVLDANQFISTLDIRLVPSPAPSVDRDSQNSTPMGSPALSGRWGPDVPLLPAALERQVKIKKGTDPLGLSVEMVDKGVNGMVVKSIQKQGAVHKDGTLHVGDYILSVNNETMKNITRSQARAILKRVDLLTSDIAVKYIPLGDAAIHMQTIMLTQQQGRESPVSAFARQPSPSSPFIPSRLTESDAEDDYITGTRFTPLTSSSSYSLSSSVPTAATTPSVLTPSSLPADLPSPFSDIASPNSQRQFLDASTLERPVPVVPVSTPSPGMVVEIKAETDASTNGNQEDEDTKSSSFQEKRALFQAKSNSISTPSFKPAIAAKPVLPKAVSPSYPNALKGLKSPTGYERSNSPPLPKELEELDATLLAASRTEMYYPSTPVATTPSQGQAPPVQFGPERCVDVWREPNRGLGISIVWGQVDLSRGNHIAGIFIKNVLPESPAGRSGSLKRGDRILEVDGQDLRDASHDKAVDVIKNSNNPVKFLVQSLLPVPKDEADTQDSNKFAVTPTLRVDRPISPHFKEKTSPVQEHLMMVTPPKNWPQARTPSPELIQRGDFEQSHLDTSHQGDIISPTGQVKGPMPDLVKERPGFTVTSFASAPEPTRQYSSETDDSEEEVDERDLQGKGFSKQGVEIDRSSAGYVKLSPSEKETDTEEDMYGYTLKKVQKKYAELKGELLMVELMKGSNGLGLSLAGNKDRTKMSVFICGMHPRGNAFKDGRLRVGDEVLEVNGVVLFGRCHLNASAMIKGLSGSSYKMILLRRDDALEDMAVKPITQFPVHLDDVTNEKYAKYKGVKKVTVRKGAHGLGIMIIEGKHAEAGKGIFISDIQEVSPAEQAGLNVGDMILSVNQVDMTTADYDTAAQLLKQAEGLITLVVSVPGKVSSATSASNEEDKSASSALNDENSANGEKKTSPPVPPPKPAHLSVKSPSKMPHRSSSISSPEHRVTSTTTTTSVSSSAVVTRSSSVSASSKIPSTQISSRVPPTIEDGSSTASQDPTLDHQLIVPPVTVSDPKTSPIIPGQEVTIEITKEKMGLGLSIVGGSDTPLGTVIIHEVYPDGAAALDGRLRPGDQILEVNGEDLREAPHEAAITALRQTPSAVRIVVYREEGQNHEEDLYDIIEVALFKKQGRGLGLSIVGRKNGPGVYISEVVKGGVAEADGRLMQGDQIIEVNEQDLKTATQEYAAAILKTTTGRITMKIGRLKAGSRRSVSGPKTNDIADVPLQYKTITLERGPDGLGFSIVGGCGSPHGDLPIYVKTVFEKGAAAENGLLQRGDQLVMVNDQSLEGVTHEEAVDILKNAKGTVTLTILS